MRKLVFLITIALGIWFGADIIAHAQANPQTNLPPAILEFRTPTEDLVLAELESTGVSLEFHWQVDNIQVSQRIFIEQYQLNDWNVVAGDEELLSSNGMLEILAAHPQNFTSPTYRIVVRDAEDNILTQRMLVIPYAVEPTLLPDIQKFGATETTVYADDLQDGNARVALQWTVQNRLPNTNLVFEQVISETEAANIELPRYELWIPSISQGAVAPQSPVSGNTITIRLQLRDMLSGEVYDEALVTLEIVPGSSAPPPTAVPAATGNSADIPEIEFTGSQSKGNRGDNIDLTWHVTDAVSVQIEERAIPGEPAQLMFEDAPLSASLPFMVPLYASHELTWILTATNAQGQSTSTSVSVSVPCTEPVSFTVNCPYVNDQLTLAYQPFENGFMMWRAATQKVSGDTRLIYVFKNDGTYTEASDGWIEDHSYEIEGTPPEGLFLPERGFGYLYSTTPSLIDTLGWATDSETGYQGQYVIVGFVHKQDTFMGYTNWIAEEFLVLPDQRIIRLVDGQWQFVE